MIKAAIRYDKQVVYPTKAPFDPADNFVYHMVEQIFADMEMDKDNLGTDNWSPFSDFIEPGNTVLLKPNLVLNMGSEKIS